MDGKLINRLCAVSFLGISLAFAAMASAQVPGAMTQSVCCGISTANGPTSRNFQSFDVNLAGGSSQQHDHVRIGFSHQRSVIVGSGYYPTYPYYYPGYPYTGYLPSLPPTPAPAAEEATSDAAEPPGYTVYERRKEYKLAQPAESTNTKDAKAGPNDADLEPHAKLIDVPPTTAATPEENIITTLVYKDGHQRELRDYAVIGGAIYDLSRKPGSGPNKILLADLDLDATLKLNQDRGVEFNLPKSIR